jgi:hypothetical protein
LFLRAFSSDSKEEVDEIFKQLEQDIDTSTPAQFGSLEEYMASSSFKEDSARHDQRIVP